MMYKLIIVLLFLVSPGNCLRILTQRNSRPCVKDYSVLWEAGKQFCYDNVTGICDYHFTQNKLYCVDSKSTGHRLLRFGLDTYSEGNSTDISYITHGEPKDVAVDWYNNKYYVIYDNLMVGSLDQYGHSMKLDNVITQDTVAANTREPSVKLRRVLVDPYVQLLFVLVSFQVIGDQTFDNILIASSTLEGNDITTILTRQFKYTDVKFGVDISERKLHFTHQGYIFTYNYEGGRKNIYNTPSNVVDISAFDDQIYMYNQVYTGNYVGATMYILAKNNAHFRKYHLRDSDINGECERFKIIDPRVQREKGTDKFKCDRKDCPDSCEVHPLVGDLCISDPNKRMKNELMQKGGFWPDIQLYGQNMSCLLHYTDQYIIERCLILNNGNGTVIDNHMTDGYTYHIDKDSSSQLKRMAFNFTVNEHLIQNIKPVDHDTKTIDGISIDWVRNILYAITDEGKNIMKGELFEQYQTILLNKLTIMYKRYDKFNITYTAIQVDPYKQILFLQTSIRHSSSEEQKYMAFNLESHYKKVIGGKQCFADTKFYVDINEIKVYILDDRVLHVYNYEGTLLKSLDIAIPVNEFIVFMNTMYVTAIGDTGVTKLPLNDTNLPKEFYQSQYHGMNKDVPLKIRLLDARIQRRMENETFACDRKDCPYQCEVLSTGDVCLCPKDKAKKKDGITCYECGQSNLTSMVLNPTIVNGNSSGIRDFPWHATLYKLNDTLKWDAICGGSIISSRAVLTAAHCVMTVCLNCQPTVLLTDQLRVALGKIRRSWYIDEPHGKKVELAEIRVSKDYKGTSANYANDIAILLLNSSVSFNEYIMPVCLDYSLNQLPPHETLDGYVPGFGKTEDCVGVCAGPSEDLKYTKARVMSYTTCFEVSNKIDKSTYHRLTSDKFCIGNGSESAVQKGDSGGGLTLEYHGLHYVTGIVSVKLTSVKDQSSFKYSFGAFTNVSKHMDWIKENMPDG